MNVGCILHENLTLNNGKGYLHQNLRGLMKLKLILGGIKKWQKLMQLQKM